MNRQGRVFLVGAGPGHPGLITRRGMELLRRADLVLYDHLANEALLTEIRSEAATIYAGKEGSHHFLEQREINQLMIREARRGKQVVRLKGGDPFVFGRGGEEALALAKAGIPFEVIPGVTSPIAAPAYAGIPVTHRDYTSTVAFVTGHEALTPDPSHPSPLPWEALAQIGTVVFLMGTKNLEKIAARLIRAGKSPDTPVAVIEQGTLPQQRVVEGRLDKIAWLARRAGLKPPAVTVVGKAVALRKELNWLAMRSLYGKKILVTRSRDQASSLSDRLVEEGATVLELPTIEIRPPTSWKRLDRAIRRIETYDWVIFASVNAVRVFFERLEKKGRDLRDLKGIRIAAVGPSTAKEIGRRGLRVDSLAQEYRAEGLVRVLAKDIRRKKILIPRAKGGREILVSELKRLGATVDSVEAYRTVQPKRGRSELGKMIRAGVDLITFASSSAVENFVKMAGPSLRAKIRGIPAACIGPVTTQTARKFRLQVKIQPKQYTIPALVEAIASGLR